MLVGDADGPGLQPTAKGWSARGSWNASRENFKKIHFRVFAFSDLILTGGWISVWNEMQIICILSTDATPSSYTSLKSRMVKLAF